MSEDERRAVFYKLEHDMPVNLSGTGLQPLGEPGQHVTLAVPREDNLNRLTKKVHDFGSGQIRGNRPPNAEIDRLNAIGQGEPTDRLSDALFRDYKALTKKAHVICEIEIIWVQLPILHVIPRS